MTNGSGLIVNNAKKGIPQTTTAADIMDSRANN